MTLSDVLKQLFDNKKIDILQVFIQNPQDEFTLKEVVKKSRVPLASTHRILKHLLKLQLIQKHIKKHLTTYKLADNGDARELSKLLYEKPHVLAKFVDLIASLQGIEQVLMHGKETENKANVVIVGSGIDKSAINAAVAQIREEENFSVNHLILEPEQYRMLSNMGQFSGSKTPLFSK